MSTYQATPQDKGQANTRTQTMDNFKHFNQILDIGLSSELEREIQSEDIHSTRHILQMIDDVLNNLEYK